MLLADQRPTPHIHGEKNWRRHRLERLQSELHKTVPDIDRIWGMFEEAGVMLGKFGKDAKPLVDLPITRGCMAYASDWPQMRSYHD